VRVRVRARDRVRVRVRARVTPTLHAVDDAQVAQVHGDLGVLVAQRGLVDGEGAQVEGHGLGVLVLVAEGVAQVDEVLGHLGVLGAQGLLVDGEGRHVQRHLQEVRRPR